MSCFAEVYFCKSYICNSKFIGANPDLLTCFRGALRCLEFAMTNKVQEEIATQAAVAKPDGPEQRRKLRPVGAVTNAIRVLRYLAQANAPAGATQIARAVDMYPGTCYQVLRTLVGDDLLAFDEKTKSYSLVAGFRSVIAPRQSVDAVRYRKDRITELSETHQTTVYLIARLTNERGVLVDFVQHPTHVPRSVVSAYETVYVGSMGRLVTYMLHKDRSDWPGIFASMPWDRTPTYRSWESEVEAVGRLGYAVDRGYRTKGLTVVSAPIVDSLGELNFFLASLRFVDDLDEAAIAQLGAATKSCAEDLRHDMAVRALGTAVD